MTRCNVVFVTTSSNKEAEKIARALLEEKYAACVSIVPKIKSSYWWKGKIETSTECLLIIKTVSTKVQGLIKKVKSCHSYDVPEVIALSIDEGNQDYLKWVQDNV